MQMATIFVKHPETQSQCLSQLGAFSKLPTEIRLMIWEALFPDSRKPQPPRKYRRPVPPTKIANILHSSRFLYHGIRTLLYRNLEFRFIINQRRVKFQATSKTLQIDWRFDSARDMDKFHSTFPFSTISTPHFEIEIRGAKYPGKGSIFTQWAMVNKVVEFVERLPIPPYVHVSFVKHWVEDGSPRKDIHRLQLEVESLDTEFENTEDTQDTQCCPLTDYNVLILPFTTSSLTNWHYTLPAELRAAVLEDPDALNQTRLHIFKMDNPTKVDGSNEVYTTFEISETSQRHYIYEPCETSRTEEWVEKVKDTFDDYVYSLVYDPERSVLEPTHDEIIEKLDETSRFVHWNYFSWPFLP
jgi:hypothetical protein